MEKYDFDKAMDVLTKESKRKFPQSVDLIVTLRDLNIKNPDEQVDFFLNYSHSFSKKKKVVVLAGPELAESAEGVVDLVIKQQDFDKYTDKKLAKKVADEYDFFVAQADIMPKVATVFGRVLGPRGKMPNPKLGSVLPGKAPVEPVYKKLQKTVRVVAKKSLNVQVKVGDENMDLKHVKENLIYAYNQILAHLPKEKSNVNKVMLKLTMSKAVELDI